MTDLPKLVLFTGGGGHRKAPLPKSASDRLSQLGVGLGWSNRAEPLSFAAASAEATINWFLFFLPCRPRLCL